VAERFGIQFNFSKQKNPRSGTNGENEGFVYFLNCESSMILENPTSNKL